MTELEQALLNLLTDNPKIIADVIKANPQIVLDVVNNNRIQPKRCEVVMEDGDMGAPFSYRKNSDKDSRFRLSQNLDTQGHNTDLFPTFMFGNGTNPPWHSFGLINADNGKGEQRNLLEFNSRNQDGTLGNHIGIVFNTRDGHSISITAEHGELVIRDEYQGTEPIAIIK